MLGRNGSSEQLFMTIMKNVECAAKYCASHISPMPPMIKKRRWKGRHMRPRIHSNLQGQASLEVMMLFAAVLVMILAVGVALPSTTTGSENLRQLLMARQAVGEVASAADEVFLAGEGASKTIWIEVPGGFDNLTSFIGNRSISTAWKDKKLVDINLLASGDVFAVSRAPMCGRWPGSYGKYRINVTYNATTTPHVSINAKC